MPKHDHTAILQTVRQELPPEELICDLSDLFKVFGDTTRMRILYSLFESELCVCAIAELLGMTVCDAATGETLGEITRVDSYPAHKVYTVRGAREYLIPAVPDVFIKSVDLDANRMEVQVWEGMATDEN